MDLFCEDDFYILGRIVNGKGASDDSLPPK